ncbi:amidohydrolase family protein [Ceratobasidium sp. AG-Ba]|nr:amidohydrolase family protein [Ceratobasidium sp. AG-Ba]QRV99423.1 amidohydrolase family protein [Ceratobasidium sp. AG-Ba]QRW13930.1 amidohydrolase family protein [Ceratobasidium sp. AG-Ba]
MPPIHLFHGGLISPVSIHEAQYLERALLAVSSEGVIEWIEHDVDPTLIQDVALKHGLELDSSVEIYELKHGEWLMPGFVDTHTHAPQFPNIGIGGQYELLKWLENVTFPTESRFSDLEFARSVYTTVIDRVLSFGTTTCCYYGTLHLEATKLLADIISQKGQRAFVGKCNMNRESPSYQEASSEQSVADTQTLISYIRSLSPSNPLVHPILTPRFAISCTSELLKALGKIAQSDPTLAIQTHISENKSEIAYTLELFKNYPGCTSYAGVYKEHGLLSDRTILAHAVHLTEEELNMVKECEAGVSHCPTSNFYLNSGVCKVGDMLDRGIKVGLGTDCSGGFSPSIINAVRDAVIASKVIAMSSPSSDTSALANRTLPLATLLHLSTLGGAQLCNLSTEIGSLEPGKQFDAILVNVRGEAGNGSVWAGEKDSLSVMLEKFFMGGDDRNIRRVWVRGRLVSGVDA